MLEHLCKLVDSSLQVPLEEMLLLVKENVKDNNAELPFAAGAGSGVHNSVGFGFGTWGVQSWHTMQSLGA